MSIRATSPFPVFLDADGKPLTGGYVYFGVAGANPETTPQAVYWDEALTIPAAQPVRTINGFPAYNGSPGNIFTASAYSVTVKNKNGVLMYSALTNPGVMTTVSAYIQTLLDDANALAAQKTLGLVPVGTAAAISAFIQSLLNDADAAEANRTLTSIKAVASADYVILDADGYTVIEVTTGAADRTITLPARANNASRHFVIRKADSGAGKVIVARAGADTINGATSWDITRQYDYVVLEENGTEWSVIGEAPARSIRETGTGAAVLKSKVIEIGDWNMDTTVQVTVAHGLTEANIRWVEGSIRGDAGSGARTNVLPISNLVSDGSGGTEVDVTIQGWSATDVYLTRRTGGICDSAAFDATSYNRGWITVWYEA